MFCKNCGQEVDGNAVVCPHCGVQVGKIETPANNTNTDGNTIAIVGFVFSFLIALVGLICSIMGYKNAKQGAPYKGLALAGIIISVAEMALSFLLSIIIVAAAGSVA